VLKKDIQKIKIKGEGEDKDKKYIPIVYYKSPMKYVSDNTLRIDKYSQFRNFEEKEHKFGKIFDIIQKEFKINILDLKIILFTMINLTDSTTINNRTITTNNPPNPPYINIAKLKYLYFVAKRYKTLNMFDKQNVYLSDALKLAKEIAKDCSTYEFFNKNNIKFNINNEYNIEQMINSIDKSNATTLLGTLETSIIIKNPYNNYFINTIMPDEFNKYNTENELHLTSQATNEITNIQKKLTEIKNTHINNNLEKVKIQYLLGFTQNGGYRKNKNFMHKINKYMKKLNKKYNLHKIKSNQLIQ